ncbi:hypothetical protein BCE02nite_33480 [Brevibacillus centrosporus]|uniref:Uncharacterized protein n=1 Tax=Brevibacillus centrosporus TaxID=54910 RepID=A0A1I3VR90_9BACL|nr:hypothetical protein BCE02nite_33480 [Brevibacillus centrosporus]SFJ96787.1 hypothetical protein SAMN05518846_107103 [Brevibacillus centrosporus]
MNPFEKIFNDQVISRLEESGTIPLYNGELSRILYAFSCFNKEVTYNEERDAYRITLSFLMDDREYILSKIRFLGSGRRQGTAAEDVGNVCEGACEIRNY